MRSKDINSSEEVNDDDKSWHEATLRAKPLLPIHTLFSNSVRFLNGTLSYSGEMKNISPLMILMSSPRIRALFYAACLHLYPERLETKEPLDPLLILEKLGADTICSVLALRYLSSKIENLCNEKIWLVLSQEFRAQMQVGVHLGRNVEKIGIARGLLAGGLRSLALATIARKDTKTFREYRRIVHKKNVLFDIPAEQRLWGCNHLQVSAVILQGFGFGVSAAKGLGVGLYPNIRLDSILDPPGKVWRDAALWIEAIVTSESPGESLLEFYGEEANETFRKIQGTVEKLGSDITKIPWLPVDMENLPKEVRKQLKLSPELEIASPADKADDLEDLFG